MKTILTYVLIILNILFLVYSFNAEKTYREEKTHYVEVKGAVVNPDVYELKTNETVADILKKSGGILASADISITNLARIPKAEDVIIIYTKEEVGAMRSGNTAVKYIDKECVCPVIEKADCLANIITNIDGVIKETGKISLNSATIEELMTLPNIGESRAKDIIAYRDTNRGFKSIDELKNVKGIGEATYEKLYPYLTL